MSQNSASAYNSKNRHRTKYNISSKHMHPPQYAVRVGGRGGVCDGSVDIHDKHTLNSSSAVHVA